MSDNKSGQDQLGLWDPPVTHAGDHRDPGRRPSRGVEPRSARRAGEESARTPAPSATPAAGAIFMPEDLWGADRVATYLGVPKQTLYGWRHSGKGPKGFRVGKHLRWRPHTVVEWTLELERDQ